MKKSRTADLGDFDAGTSTLFGDFFGANWIAKRVSRQKDLRHQRHHRRLSCEVLENRQLLSIGTTTALLPASSAAVYGESVLLTAQVVGDLPETRTPTGTVTLWDGGTELGTQSLTAEGTAEFSVSSLAVGSHSLVAIYSGEGEGDEDYSTSTSDTSSLDVTKAFTTTTLAISSPSNTYGDSVTFTASVDVVLPGSGTPTGTVDFMEGSNVLATVALAVDGTAQFSTTSFTAGTHSVTAVYSGDSSFLDSTDSTDADVTAKVLTFSGLAANNKVYDGTTAATLDFGSVEFAGLIEGDSIGLSGGVAAFANKNVGDGKDVAVTGLQLTGDSAGNYVLSDDMASLTADITALHVTGSFTVENKVYDGVTTATVLTRLPGEVIEGDSISLIGGTATFDTKNIGTDKAVTLAGASLDGDDAGNYVLDDVNTTTADVTVLHVTGSFTVENKVYDGGTSATVLTRLSGAVIEGDSVSLIGGTATFDTKNVGTDKTVALAGASLDGDDAGNYVLDDVNTTLADITLKSLVVTGITAENKMYDGTTEANLGNLEGTELDGVVDGDNVLLVTAGAVGTFVDANVGMSKLVNVSGLSLDGEDKDNYALISPIATADITVKALTFSGLAANNKVYDGTTAATLNFGSVEFAGLIDGDSVSLSGGVAAFTDKNVGDGRDVAVTGLQLTGDSAGNYVLSDDTAGLTADITVLHVTGSFTAESKVYDGGTSATVLTRLPGAVIEGDSVSLIGGTATFDTKNVGVDKTVTLTGASLSGDDASNYMLDGVDTTTADITPKSLLVTGITAESKVYDGTTVAILDFDSPALDGVLEGENVTLDTTLAIGAFASKNVGLQDVTIGGLTLGGDDAGNYMLSETTTTAEITVLHVTGSFTVENKIYDGGTSATVLTRLPGAVIEGDSISLIDGTATFDTKNVGTNKTVTLTDASLSGDDAGNYMLDGVDTTTADVTVLHVTGNFTVEDKVYDGGTSATILTRLPGTVIDGDSVSLIGGMAAFDSKNVGTDKTVTLVEATLSGNDAGNYVLDGVDTTTADIAVLHVTGSFTVENKVYDGGTSATVLTRLPGEVIEGDSISLIGGTATFDTKNVGTDKTVTLAGASLDGDDAGNYVLDGVDTTTADITKATLMVTANNASRIYGQANPTFTATITGFKNSETLATSGVTGNASLTTTATTTSPAGTYTVTAGLGSLAAGNYDFAFVNGTLTITANNTDTIGLYDPATSIFSLRNSNDSGNPDLTFQYGFGNSGWLTVIGDWNGDGVDTIGLYNQTTAMFYLRNSNDSGYADLTFWYGPAGNNWIPIAGDWNGDGIDTIGLYNPTTSKFYLRNTNTTGIADLTFQYGPLACGWTPIVGNWDGNGGDTIGLYSPATSQFYLRNTNTAGFADLTFQYGPLASGWKPIVNDWNGNGEDTIGLYNPSSATMYLRNTNTAGFADLTFIYGTANAGLMPVVGNWIGTGQGHALMASDGAATASANVSSLTEADLKPIVQEAISRWNAAGLDAATLAKLQRIQFIISDFSGSQLGMTHANTIYLDNDAAGHGWFVDATPGSDEEFATSADGDLQTIDAKVADRIDLLTVVEHELGHIAGLDDLELSLDDLMSSTLSQGTRHTVSVRDIDAVFAGYERVN